MFRRSQTRLAFEPVRSQQALQALSANVWKSGKQHNYAKRVDLIGTLATQLLLENGWAFFHFDGDRSWAEAGSSENVAKFKELIREKVQQRIQMGLEKREREAGKAVVPREIEALAIQRMSRLKTVVPFYSMEAWLFQNTREATRLCETHYGGRDAEQFRKWEQNRPALDEVPKPKEQVCLGAKHNLELATNGFPAREAHAAGRSFAAVVQALSQDAELREALSRTYSYD